MIKPKTGQYWQDKSANFVNFVKITRVTKDSVHYYWLDAAFSCARPIDDFIEWFIYPNKLTTLLFTSDKSLDSTESKKDSKIKPI